MTFPDIFRRRFCQIAAILALTSAVYLPALKAGFMYDDRFFIQENHKIREWRYLPEYFADSAHSMASIFWDGIWRPLRTVSYLADYKIWGLNPFGFHLTSLLWHLLNVAQVILLLDLLFQRPRLSLAAGLIFALHPVQTEAVSWISSRGDLMYVAFGLAMFIFHYRFRTSQRTYLLGLSLLSLVLALLSKETAVVLPILLMLYDWLFKNQGKLKALLAGWKTYLPFLTLLAVYLIARRLALGRVSQCPYWGDSLWTTIFTMFRAALDYVRLLFLPLWLRVDYVYDLSTSLLDWRVLGSLAMLGGISFLAWRDANRSKFLTFGWLWLVIGLLPVSNLLPLTAIMAERFLYLPLAGFAVWAGNHLSRIAKREMFLAVLLALALPMAGLTVRRNIEWQEPEKFWRTEVERSPGSYIARGNLGNIYLQQGDLAAAEREYRRAVELDSTYDNALSGMAIACVRAGRLDEAEHFAGRCLAYNPHASGALLTMGISRAAQGQLDSAEAWFSRAVKANPADEKAWANLGAICRQRGDWERAEAAYQRALLIKPRDHELQAGLGAALAGQGDIGRARKAWQKSLEINPGYLPARMNLALALEEADPAEAIRQWALVLQQALEQGEPINREFIERRIAKLHEKASR